jgi:hypothetical protein
MKFTMETNHTIEETGKSSKTPGPGRPFCRGIENCTETFPAEFVKHFLLPTGSWGLPFWVMTLCILVLRRNTQPPSSQYELKATFCYEASVPVCYSTWYLNPEWPNVSAVVKGCKLWLLFVICGPGGIFGITTIYGLDGPGIESRWGG